MPRLINARPKTPSEVIFSAFCSGHHRGNGCQQPGALLHHGEWVPSEGMPGGLCLEVQCLVTECLGSIGQRYCKEVHLGLA